MCPDTATLSAYFDNELSAAERTEIESHLPNCPACRATLELFGSQRNLLLADRDQSQPNHGSLEGFWQFVGRSRLHKISGPRRIAVPVPLAAAAILALVVATVLNFLPGDNHKNMPPVVVVDQRPQSPTVVSLTITPGEVEDFLALLEGSEGFDGEAIHELPAELPVARIGEPQIVRPASLEGAP